MNCYPWERRTKHQVGRDYVQLSFILGAGWLSRFVRFVGLVDKPTTPVIVIPGTLAAVSATAPTLPAASNPEGYIDTVVMDLQHRLRNSNAPPSEWWPKQGNRMAKPV